MEHVDAHSSETRHEAFAQGLASGQTATDAYVGAGYKPSRAHASRLAADGTIRGRVSELRAEALKHAEAGIAVTIGSLTEMLLADRELAHQTKQPSAAIMATERLARLHGFGFDP